MNSQVAMQQLAPPGDPTRSRFSDASWFKWLQSRPVLVIGAGGIGSWVCLCLARIGCRVTVMDHDSVEIHNLGGQLYKAMQVNMNKSIATAANCFELAGAGSYVNAVQGEFNDNSFVSRIIIMAVDNMKTRKLAFDKWLRGYGSSTRDGSELFIDGRLLAEDYQVYAVTPDQEEMYRETLFSDAEVPTEQCTLKSTTHCSLGIASDIIGLLTNFAANRVTMQDPEIGIEVRDVPFKIVKSIPNFMYDVTFASNVSNKSKSEKTSKGSSVTSTSEEGRANNRDVLHSHIEEPEVIST